MKTTSRILIASAVVAVAALAFVAKERGKSPVVSAETSALSGSPSPPDGSQSAITAKLPKLLDLGADKCIPCKMMAPILAEFKRDYADQFVTEFIDVWKDPAPGKQYGIRAIPTQIFFDAEGKELFRHEGFYGREDMLNKWKELGVEIRSPSAAAN